MKIFILVHCILTSFLSADVVFAQDISLSEYFVPSETMTVSETDVDRFFEELEALDESELGNAGGTVTFGRPATKYQFPGVVRLGPSNLCTGTLIHERVVLTAAHCVVNEKGLLFSRIAVSVRKTRADDKERKIWVQAKIGETIIIHPQAITKAPCAPGTTGNQVDLCFSRAHDLALLLLPRPVPDAETRVVPLATANDTRSSPPQIRTLIGYGHNYFDLNTNRIRERKGDLYYVSSGFVPIKLTGANLRNDSFRMSSFVELSGETMSVVVCNGDSGGPFLLTSNTGETTILGVNHAVRYGGSAKNCATPPDNISYIAGLIPQRSFIDNAIAQFGL